MPYIEGNDPARRMKAIIAVAGVHAALGVMLVSGLTYSAIVEKLPGHTPIREFKLDPPPPPEPSPRPDQEESDIVPDRPAVAPTPDLPLVIDTPISRAPFEPEIPFTDMIPGPGTGPVAPNVEPSHPSPSPSFSPTRPAPLNGPAGWITDDDYPRIGIRRELEGSLSYRLAVGSDGRASDCTITRSSGHDVLDEAACRWVLRRARFEPARNASGEKVAGSYSGSVSWRIPD